MYLSQRSHLRIIVSQIKITNSSYIQSHNTKYLAGMIIREEEMKVHGIIHASINLCHSKFCTACSLNSCCKSHTNQAICCLSWRINSYLQWCCWRAVHHPVWNNEGCVSEAAFSGLAGARLQRRHRHGLQLSGRPVVCGGTWPEG